MAKNTKATGTTAHVNAPVVTGNPAITTAIQDLQSGLGSVASLIGQPLTAAERKHLIRARRNGQQLIAPMIGLANRIPQLMPVGDDPQALAQQLALYQQMLDLQTVADSIALSIGDTTFRMEAALWTATLAIYGIALHSVGKDPEVAVLVSQMQAALATGPRKSGSKSSKKKASTPVTTEPAGGTTPASGTTPAGTPGTGSGSSTSVPVYTPDGKQQ